MYKIPSAPGGLFSGQTDKPNFILKAGVLCPGLLCKYIFGSNFTEALFSRQSIEAQFVHVTLTQ